MSASSTADPTAARAHARAQAGTVVEAMPILPPAEAEHWPEGVAPGQRLWAETVGGGNYTSLAIRAGALIELTDLEGEAAPHIVLLNALQPDERLNVADTVKVQWQAYLGEGSLLLSDRGRALATIVSDSSGHHDALSGTSTRARNAERYGEGEAQSASPAGRELLILAAAKQGLEPRDIALGLTLFRQVRVAEDGAFAAPTAAPAGSRVVLRAELPLLLLLANVAHPLDPRDEYVSTPLRVRIWSDGAARTQPAPDAPPEALRAYQNTAAYAALRGIA